METNVNLRPAFLDSLEDLAQEYGDLAFLCIDLARQAAEAGNTEVASQYGKRGTDSLQIANQNLHQIEETVEKYFHLQPTTGFDPSGERGDYRYRSLGKAALWRSVWITRAESVYREELGRDPEARQDLLNLAMEGHTKAYLYFRRFSIKDDINLVRVMEHFKTLVGKIPEIQGRDAVIIIEEVRDQYGLDDEDIADLRDVIRTIY